MPNDPTPPPIRLTNPYIRDCDSIPLTVRVPKDVDTYFFAKVLAGQRGSMQAILATFLDKFYRECQARALPAHYDPDNSSRIAQILHELNFRPERQLAPPRRRAPASPPKRKGKPTVG